MKKTVDEVLVKASVSLLKTETCGDPPWPLLQIIFVEVEVYRFASQFWLLGWIWPAVNAIVTVSGNLISQRAHNCRSANKCFNFCRQSVIRTFLCKYRLENLKEGFQWQFKHEQVLVDIAWYLFCFLWLAPHSDVISWHRDLPYVSLTFASHRLKLNRNEIVGVLQSQRSPVISGV